MYPYFFVNLITALLITNARETTTKKIRTDWAPRRQIREEKCDLIKTTCLSYRVTVRESVWNVLEYIIMWARSIDKVNKNHFNAKSLINLNKSYEHHACTLAPTRARTAATILWYCVVMQNVYFKWNPIFECLIVLANIAANLFSD